MSHRSLQGTCACRQPCGVVDSPPSQHARNPAALGQALAEDSARVAQLREELLSAKRSASAASAAGKEGAARAAELAAREAALEASRQELAQRERQLGQVISGTGGVGFVGGVGEEDDGAGADRRNRPSSRRHCRSWAMRVIALLLAYNMPMRHFLICSSCPSPHGLANPHPHNCSCALSWMRSARHGGLMQRQSSSACCAAFRSSAARWRRASASSRR